MRTRVHPHAPMTVIKCDATPFGSSRMRRKGMDRLLGKHAMRYIPVILGFWLARHEGTATATGALSCAPAASSLRASAAAATNRCWALVWRRGRGAKCAEPKW